MKFEFKLYEINTNTKLWKQIIKNDAAAPNDFIIIGEDEKYYKTHHIGNEGLILIPGLAFGELAYLINKEDLKLQGNGVYFDTMTLDIPKKLLTVDIIESIIMLNE